MIWMTAWLFLAGTRYFTMVWYNQNFKHHAIILVQLTIELCNFYVTVDVEKSYYVTACKW
jgi:hypothetical protein